GSLPTSGWYHANTAFSAARLGASSNSAATRAGLAGSGDGGMRPSRGSTSRSTAAAATAGFSRSSLWGASSRFAALGRGVASGAGPAGGGGGRGGFGREFGA